MLQKDIIKILIISIISVAANLIVFYTLFIILFYIDIRKQYTNTNKNKKYITKDIKKLITTLGIAEIGYLSTYAISAFTLLDDAQISITSTIPAWIVYIFMANIIIIKYRFL
jgi:hypothetical protein